MTNPDTLRQLAIDDRTVSIFEQGRKCARSGGYRADNPHSYATLDWDVWAAGFEDEEGPSYRQAMILKLSETGS